MSLLPAAAASAVTQDASRPEIIVKLRASATLEAGASHVLETLTGGYQASGTRPLVTGAERQRTLLRRLRTMDRSLLTPGQRRLLLRQRRGDPADDGPEPGGVYRMQVDLAAGQTVQELLGAWRRNPDVEYAELNHVVSACVRPDDPQYAKQWSMEKIAAPEAWDTCQGGEQVIVAVIDTGVDYNHRDLHQNMWCNEAELNGSPHVDDDDNGYVDDVYGYNFAYSNSDPIDDQGHGTHCAGIIAAVGDNGLDIAGICWTARIMAIKILDAEGNGTSADAVPAIYYAVANGADVISMSWGGEDESQAVKEAMAYARRQGVLIVAAAGNEGTSTPFYPAAYPGAIAVAATESSDKRTYGSNYGDWVDIAAPGRDILSLWPTDSAGGALTSRMSGTSMAAPHVAGACALMLAADPLLTCDEVDQIVLTTGDTIAKGICASNSRLNVAKAMRAVVPAQGVVRFDRPTYAEGDEIGVLLADWNLRGSGTRCVDVGTDGDELEELILTETPEAKGVFRGTIAGEQGGARPGDGRVQAHDGERLVVRYWNLTYGGGGSVQRVEGYAHADYQAPTLVQQSVEMRGMTARIELTTSEVTRAQVRYSRLAEGPFTLTADDGELSDRHSVKIAGLRPGTKYYFMVSMTDRAGNEAVADNEGQHYSFETSGEFTGFRVPSVYPTIQAAVDDAWDGDTVWLADGAYSGAGNIEIDFHGRAITVRSDNGPSSCIIDCQRQARAFYFHSGEGKESVVEGLTIARGGNVDCGGGVQCVGSSPTLRNCVFRDNSADSYGGGLYNAYGSSPTVIGCTFEGNACSTLRSAGSGGGVANRHDSHPTLQDCTFSGNAANEAGGGIANLDTSVARVTGCLFVGNTSRGSGGAVYNEGESRSEFTTCILYANSADEDGGGLYCGENSETALSGCILSGNCTDRDGGAVTVMQATLSAINCTISGNAALRRHGGVESRDGATVRLENSILWGNMDKSGGAGAESSQVAAGGGTVTADYCCVQGLAGDLGGLGNIGDDPLFVDAASVDFHLCSQGWRWDSARSGWTYDSRTSLCIDAGNPARPLGEEPVTSPSDPNALSGTNVRIDMGAYGGTSEASMAPPQWMLLADLTNDRRVDWLDVASLAADWATAGEARPGDLSRDGAVGGGDLVLLGVQWRHEADSTASGAAGWHAGK